MVIRYSDAFSRQANFPVMKKQLSRLLITYFSLIMPVHAAPADFSWQLGLGMGIGHSYNLIRDFDDEQNKKPQLQIMFVLEYKKLFMETPGLRAGRLVDDATLGYRFYRDDQHEFSLIAASYHDAFGPTVGTAEGIRTRTLEGLNDRDDDLVLGFRYQYQATDKQLLSLNLGRDLLAHEGGVASAFYGVRFEQGNWDIYLNSELKWYSEALVDYYYGVTPAESRADRPIYKAGQGWRWHSGVVGVYPLSTRWIFETGVGGNWYSSSFSHSPLTRGNKELVSFGLVRYLF